MTKFRSTVRCASVSKWFLVGAGLSLLGCYLMALIAVANVQTLDLFWEKGYGHPPAEYAAVGWLVTTANLPSVVTIGLAVDRAASTMGLNRFQLEAVKLANLSFCAVVQWFLIAYVREVVRQRKAKRVLKE